ILGAIIGAIVGGALGLKSQVQTYRAQATLNVRPYVRIYATQNTSGALEQTPMYESMMNTLAANLRSDTRVAERAMQMAKWKELVDQKIVPAGMSPAAFLRGVQTVFTPKTLFIRVSYDSSDPRIAVAGAGSLVEAYTAVGLDEGVNEYTTDVEDMRRSIDDIERQITENRRKIDERLSEHGARNLQPRINDLREQLKSMNVNHRQQNLILDRMKTLKDNPAPPDPQMLTLIDPAVGDYDRQLKVATNEFERNRSQGMMENNPNMMRLRTDIDRLTKIIKDKTDKLGGQIYGTVSDLQGNQILVTEVKLRQQSDDVDGLEQQIAELESQTRIFEDLDYNVEQMREANVAAQAEIASKREQIQRLEALLETVPTKIEPKAP
ncbi:MAG TPA: hypothetical protein PK402_14335, partial [Tepidisphaeraceae bacterium]|nr:hypothetical protein [Tepidisphaeraceae bacterium]